MKLVRLVHYRKVILRRNVSNLLLVALCFGGQLVVQKSLFELAGGKLLQVASVHLIWKGLIFCLLLVVNNCSGHHHSKYVHVAFLCVYLFDSY